MGLRRGDVVLATASGDHGKIRPAVVVQSDAMLAEHPSVVLCPMSSDIRGSRVRVRVSPDQSNGLHQESEIMIDKIIVVPSEKLRSAIGRISNADMASVDQALVLLLGLAEMTITPSG